ncbi:MAG: tetratricopeptide repeat protein [Magnetococcus sp. WYHC-3]
MNHTIDRGARLLTRSFRHRFPAWGLCALMALLPTAWADADPALPVPSATVADQARQWWEQGRQDDALALLDDHLRRQPEDFSARLLRGRLRGRMDRLDAAREDLETATRLRPDSADAWGSLGWQYLLAGRFAAARDATQRAMQMDPDHLPWRINHGHALLLSGHRAAAREQYRHCFPLMPEEDDFSRVLLTDLDLFLTRGWQVDAVRELRSRLVSDWEQERPQRELRRQATLLAKDAAHAHDGGDLARAEFLLRQTLAIRREVLGEQHPETATTLHNLALVLKDRQLPGSSLAFNRQALAIREQVLGRHVDTAASLNNLASLHQDLGEFPQARALYNRALEIYRSLSGPQHPHMATCLANLAELHRQEGDLDQSLALHRQALAIRSTVLGQKHVDTALSLNNLGALYQSLGLPEMALPLLEQAQQGLESALGSTHPLALRNLANLAVVYDHQGDGVRAETLTRQVLAAREQVLGPRHVATAATLGNLAMLRLSRGDRSEARQLLRRALAIRESLQGQDHPDHGWDLLRLGIMASLEEDYPAAQEYLRQALDIAQRSDAPDLRWNAASRLGGVLALQGDTPSAAKHFESALEIIENQRGGLTEGPMRTAFMADKLPVYDDYLALLAHWHERQPQAGHDRKALEIFERRQGRRFLEDMGRSRARLSHALPADLALREQTLEHRLATVTQRLRQEQSADNPVDLERQQRLEVTLKTLRQEQAALDAELALRYPDYVALKYPRPASVSHLQRDVLRTDERLLVYAVLQDALLLWVVDREQIRMHRLAATPESLASKVAALRQQILASGNVQDEEGDDAATIRDAAMPSGMPPARGEHVGEDPGAWLYRTLFPEGALPPPGRWLHIVVSGPLYALPFEALPVSLPEPHQRPTYLVERHTLSYLSSASLLRVLRDADKRRAHMAPYPLLAVANPDFGSPAPETALAENLGPTHMMTRQALLRLGGFDPLPDTEEEARSIARLLQAPASSRPLLLGREASVATLEDMNRQGVLDDYRHVVFATHGLLPGEVDALTQPALVLSHPEHEGLLTLEGVLGLRLNARLVSLSACQTGLGTHLEGEGIMGMTRAFMYAGTPAVAVTLWSVESRSAMALNVGFFDRLRHSGDAAEALGQIKRAMIAGTAGARYQEPYYWAPLVLFGDGREGVMSEGGPRHPAPPAHDPSSRPGG